MFLPPRADPATDSCPSGHASCWPYDSSTTGVIESDTHTSYLPRFGPKRYIGLTMAIVLVLVVLIWWWVLARRKRRANQNSLNVAGVVDADADSPPQPQPSIPSSADPAPTPKRSWFCIGKRKLSELAPSQPPDSTAKEPDNFPSPEPSQQNAKNAMLGPVKEPRWMSDSRVPKGLVKEVSGGMVTYTNGRQRSTSREPRRPKPTVPRRDRRYSRRVNLDSDWHMEHIHGVRYEARTPPEAAPSTLSAHCNSG